MIVFFVFVYWEYLWKLLFHFIAVRRLVQERGIEPLFNKVGFHHSNSRCINATPYFNSRFIRPLLATAPPAYLSLLPSEFRLYYLPSSGLSQLSFKDLITCDSPLSISPTACTDGLSLLFYLAIF